MRSAVVVVFDRLGAAHLGPYGNTLLATRAFNRLAAESLTAEFCLCDVPEVAQAYRSYWQGTHALVRSARLADDRASLPGLLSSLGVATRLATDDARLAVHPLAGDFQTLHRLEAPDDASTAARVEETQLAEWAFAGAEALLDLEPPFLLWLHARALAGPWDAPLELRDNLAADDDPTPPRLVTPPNLPPGLAHDPDELLGYTQAYGGQVLVADMALEVLLDALAEHPAAADTLLLATAPRGFPLGEHGAVGSASPGLYHELVQTPLLLRHPQGLGGALRTPSLVQPADVAATLADWFGMPPLDPHWGRSLLAELADEPPPPRRAAPLLHLDQRALRTNAWYLRRTERDDAPSDLPGELYAKPDDRWEVNDVADRCPEQAAAMRAALDLLWQAAAAGLPPPSLPELALETTE